MAFASSNMRNVRLTVVTPSRTQKLPYQTIKRRLANALRAVLDTAIFERSTGGGLALETAEKGVLYPILHFSSPSNHIPMIEDEVTVKAMAEEYVVHQGIYSEVGRIEPEFVFCTSESQWRNNGNHKSYILIGFKQLDSPPFKDVIEDCWKDWTGARHIYNNLPDEFGLSRITFYKRLAPQSLNLFLYVLICECTHVTPDNLVYLRDFVNRLRSEKMDRYLSLYNRWDPTGEQEEFYRRYSSPFSSSESGSDDLGSRGSSR